MDFTETPGAEDLMMELWNVIDNRNPALTNEQVAEILAWITIDIRSMNEED